MSGKESMTDPLCPHCGRPDDVYEDGNGLHCDNCGWDSVPRDEDGYELWHDYDPLTDSED